MLLTSSRPASACTAFAGSHTGPDPHDGSTSPGGGVAYLLRATLPRVQSASDTPPADPPPPARLQLLLPPGDPVTAAELVERMGLWRRGADDATPGTAPA